MVTPPRLSDHTHAPPRDIWLDDARRLDSPNYNDRPDPVDISLLVIHNISLPAGEFGGRWIEALFCNCLDCEAHPSFSSLLGLEVSSHFFINRAGELSQFVPTNKRAWHAGQSSFQTVENCNDYSIGIELEGTDECLYTEQQYRQLVLLSKQLMQRYPAINRQRIVGHSDIAPGRKTDPGPAFDWPYYKQLLDA